MVSCTARLWLGRLRMSIWFESYSRLARQSRWILGLAAPWRMWWLHVEASPLPFPPWGSLPIYLSYLSLPSSEAEKSDGRG